MNLIIVPSHGRDNVVSFPDPTNPSVDRFQYRMWGGWPVTFVMFPCALQEFVQSQ